MNKQLLFMLTATLVGTVGALVYEPFLGVAVYYLFGVLRPQAMWMWVLPPGISWSYYVAAATMIGVLLKFRFGGVEPHPLDRPDLWGLDRRRLPDGTKP